MSENKIVFFAPLLPNRLKYITNLLLNRLLGLEVVYSEDIETYLKIRSPKLSYSKIRCDKDDFFLQSSSSLLFDKGIEKQTFPLGSSQIIDDNGTDFDLFASAFYLVSRYEEYQPNPNHLDQHGRFQSKWSTAQQQNFLERPLINEWAQTLGGKLQAKYPSLVITTTIYQFLPTFDIDMAWKYQYKGLIRTTGAIIKDLLFLRLRQLTERIQVLLKRKDDPYFQFEYILLLHQHHTPRLIFFWLLGKYDGKYDTNHNPKNPQFQRLVRNVSKTTDIGIHPSYFSNSSQEQLVIEHETLSDMRDNVGGMNPCYTRQHFLKLSFPHTYQNIVNLFLTSTPSQQDPSDESTVNPFTITDYTMGYADAIGYRASISTPFPWYNLQEEEQTKLIIQPFAIMDVTLQQYLKLSPQEAVAKVSPIIEATKKAGGTFCTLWHNSSLAEDKHWKGWKAAYEEINKQANQES
jgi:hypothetical protein